MDKEKKLFASKTFWGAVIAILAAVAPMLGIEFSKEEAGALLAAVDELIAAGGAIFAIYGRIVADKRIEL